MALTNSTMLALGTELPVFQLPDVVSGQIISPETFAGKTGILVMFICISCISGISISNVNSPVLGLG